MEIFHSPLASRQQRHGSLSFSSAGREFVERLLITSENESVAVFAILGSSQFQSQVRHSQSASGAKPVIIACGGQFPFGDRDALCVAGFGYFPDYGGVFLSRADD